MTDDQASAAPLEGSQLLAARVDDKTRATQSSSAGNANLPDFPIEDVLRHWIKDKRVQNISSTVWATSGDWEGWVRVEVDLKCRKAFSIRNRQQVREAEVYNNADEFADLVLEPDKKHKGMIIELVCEDRFANKGSSIRNSVQGEIARKRGLKEEYKGHTFEVLALTYSKAAETAVKGLGLAVVTGFEVDQAFSSDESEEEVSDEQPVTLRVFRKKITTGSAEDGVDEVTENLGGLSPDAKVAADDNKTQGGEVSGSGTA